MIDRLVMWMDGLFCTSFPHACRWNVVIVDRIEGTWHPIVNALFRWRRSADYFIKRADATWSYRGMAVQFEARPVRWTGR